MFICLWLFLSLSDCWKSKLWASGFDMVLVPVRRLSGGFEVAEPALLLVRFISWCNMWPCLPSSAGRVVSGLALLPSLHVSFLLWASTLLRQPSSSNHWRRMLLWAHQRSLLRRLNQHLPAPQRSPCGSIPRRARLLCVLRIHSHFWYVFKL